jgi:hypothetical protein
MRALLKFTLIIFLTVIIEIPSYSQERQKRKLFYIGFDMGTGLLKLSRNDNSSDRTARFGLALYGGITPVRWLRAGILVNGWTIESYGNFYENPDKGISISNTYGQIQLYPFKKYAFYINGAAGRTKYINMHPYEYNTTGFGYLTGLGYEYKLANRVYISLTCNYGAGSFDDVVYPPTVVRNQHYNVWEIMLGIRYH